MYLGRVIGTCVATVKYEGLQGTRLLIVEAIDDTGATIGAPHVAVDTTQAGPGETVFCVASREAALACDPSFVPVDAAIVGIVDAVYVPETARSGAGGETKA
ncbi:MAG: ethanolamine utilization protein EutN [Bradymonadia bacterium]|jgi:ethanolamine utilization protein EutN